MANDLETRGRESQGLENILRERNGFFDPIGTFDSDSIPSPVGITSGFSMQNNFADYSDCAGITL
jgi:hypothetical protein